MGVLRTLSSVALVYWLCVYPCHPAASRSSEETTPAISFPSPVKYEFSQRFDPFDSLGKFATERFRLTADLSPLTMRYSNQAPSLLTGLQLQGSPSSYSMAELLLTRKWGTVSVFRSTGSNSRYVPRDAARKISGAGFELPKSVLGTRITGYLLHAAPAQRFARPMGPSSRSGTQMVIGAARESQKGFRFRAELSQSWQPLTVDARKTDHGKGLYTRLEGPLLKADIALTFRAQEENLTSTLAPARGRGRELVTLDVRRKFGLHQFQYSHSHDARSALHLRQLPSSLLRQDVLRWNYAPKRFPQLAASQTQTSESGAGRSEAEESLLLSMNKSLKRMSLGLTFLRGTRIDQLTLRSLWERTGVTGDASFEIQRERRLNIRYELVDFTAMTNSTVVSSDNLQVNTRLSCFGDRLALSPALHLRRQEENPSGRHSSLLNLVFLAIMRLPRYIPGAEVAMTVSSRHIADLGQPWERTTGFVVRWTLKRS